MTAFPVPLVALFDVDNTLYDNDTFSRDLDAELVRALGAEGQRQYRARYEALRDQRGYADYLAPLQELRGTFASDPDLLGLSSFLLDYPFADRVYPRVPEMLGELSRIARTAILSDGDLVFQPWKIRRAGLEAAVQGRVLITVHKEEQLEQVQRALPATHYLMVDDKPRLLEAIRDRLGPKVTTVFVRQGHYATDAAATGREPDLRLDAIGELTLARVVAVLPATVRRAVEQMAGPGQFLRDS